MSIIIMNWHQLLINKISKMEREVFANKMCCKQFIIYLDQICSFKFNKAVTKSSVSLRKKNTQKSI